MKQKITCHIPVTMLASKWNGKIEDLPPNETFILIIDYPVNEDLVFKIKTGAKGLTLTKLLNKIGNLYEMMYHSKKYDDIIYGHDIDDLNLSEVIVDLEKKTIKLGIDS